MRRSRKPLWAVYVHRGFESLPLRSQSQKHRRCRKNGRHSVTGFASVLVRACPQFYRWGAQAGAQKRSRHSPLAGIVREAPGAGGAPPAPPATPDKEAPAGRTRRRVRHAGTQQPPGGNRTRTRSTRNARRTPRLDPRRRRQPTQLRPRRSRPHLERQRGRPDLGRADRVDPTAYRRTRGRGVRDDPPTRRQTARGAVGRRTPAARGGWPVPRNVREAPPSTRRDRPDARPDSTRRMTATLIPRVLIVAGIMLIIIDVAQHL